MLFELEWFVAECAGDIINPFTPIEAAVKHRDLGLTFGEEVAVQVDDTLVHSLAS